MTHSNDSRPTAAVFATRNARPADGDRQLWDKRLERIRDLEVASLELADPTEAGLGIAAGNLLKGTLILRECMEQMLSQDSDLLEQLPQVLPCLAVLGKLSQQLESLVTLQSSLREGRLQAQEIRSLGSKYNRSNKQLEQMLPVAVTPLDQAEPPTRKPKSKSKKRPL